MPKRPKPHADRPRTDEIEDRVTQRHERQCPKALVGEMSAPWHLRGQAPQDKGKQPAPGNAEDEGETVPKAALRAQKCSLEK